ncbi:MAG TPA: ABC transporter transmembrane domain-containing protein, partial [Terriglobales bacterium]
MFKRLQPLFPYFKKHRWGYALGSVCVLLQNGIAVTIPLLIGHAIDHLRHGVSRRGLLIDAALILGVTCAKGAFLFLNRKIVISISREIEFEMRNDIFRHLENLSYSFYQRTRTGDLMARATNDLNAVRNLLGPAIMYSANTVVLTLAALYFMVHISPWLTLCAFTPFPIVSIVVQYFGRRIHERFERIQAMFSDISARAQENFSAARVIR